MDTLVLPNMDNVYQRERAKDELPQSASGRTIMTTEPKFVPNEAIEITVGDKVGLRVRLIDCVGYVIKGALGYLENNAPRMVATPWFDHQIPFEEAADLGTKKVINEHSTIGIVIVTDGSITDIPREEYIEAEERVIAELKKINKPFVIVLNSTRPSESSTLKLRDELESKYNVPVINTNCAQLREEDLDNILERVLSEFPVSEVGINIPKWINALDDDHWLRVDIINSVRDIMSGVKKIKDIGIAYPAFEESSNVKKAYLDRINMGEGSASIELSLEDGLFYRVLSETTGLEIEGEHKLVSLMKELSRVKKEYEKIEYALNDVKMKGYGIVTPVMEEMSLEEPEIVKQGSRFGVKLRASAPSIHMIRADIETEVAPLVGTEKQSEELVNYLLKEFEGEPGKIWESNIFGKSLHELVSEGLQNKLYRMPEDAQVKLQETLQRIINEGSGGLICIIL